jgi:anti-sigma factor RsiW
MIRHDQARELLPWFANGTLVKDERTGVADHLRACGACRSEVESLDRVRRVVRDQPADDGSDLGNLDEILARIDHDGSVHHRKTPLVRWLLIAQAAAIVILVILLLVPDSPRVAGDPQPFRTLSAEQETVPPGALLRIVFADTTTERQLREIVQSVEARIVDGPSPVGVYTIRITDTQDLASVVERLRADPSVRLAEPVASR